MDIFIEQLVTKKADVHANISKIALLGLMAALSVFCVAAFLFGFVLALLVIPGVLWFGTQLIKGLHTEYEYILTNKELDIDKIIGKNKRKRMVTLNLGNAEKFGIYKEGSQFESDTTVSAHDNSYTNMWYLVCKHDSHGKVVLLFNPNDSFVLKLNKALPGRARNGEVQKIQKNQEDSNGSSTV
jgi:hypothetical protein